MLNFLRTIVLGIVEGITEWLPISSTGHMILVDEFLTLDVSESFKEFFFVAIQLGAILAVIILFWNKIWPFHLAKTEGSLCFKEKHGKLNGFQVLCNKYIHGDRMVMWFKIFIASLPAAFFGLAFDDKIDSMLTGDKRAFVVSAALIFYGILFIIIESIGKKVTVTEIKDITYKYALIIGCMQCLALVPGTSRSGTTILGAMLLGLSRTTAAEFSFFMSIPAMVGGSGIKLLQYFLDGNGFSSEELLILVVGSAVAFIVSVLAIKFLMSFIRKHDFKAFGWYRIVLGIVVLAYFIIK